MAVRPAGICGIREVNIMSNSSSSSNDIPFGHPGIPPKWTSSAKEGVGTAYSKSGRVRFTFLWSESGRWEGRDYKVDVIR